MPDLEKSTDKMSLHNGYSDVMKNMTVKQAKKDLLKYNFYSNFIKPLPIIKIDIKHKDFIEMQNIRQRILNLQVKSAGEGTILKKDKKWFKADIRDQDNTSYRIKIRFKGQNTDHIDHENKWSFRINLKGDKTIYGMRSFSIQHPSTRNWLDEILLSEIMLKNDILSPKYLLARVLINGKDIGIMNIEPVANKELLESQKRKNSVILKFRDQNSWKAVEIAQKLMREYKIDINQVYKYFRLFYKNMPIEAKNIKKREYINSIEAKSAISLLSSFLNLEIGWEDTFDRNKLITYFAILQIFEDAYYHGVEPTNTHFYYNPIIGKLEPISIDNMYKFSHINNKVFYPTYRYAELFSCNPNFLDSLWEKGYEITSSMLNSNEYEDIYKLLNDYYYPIMKSEFPYLEPINLNKLKARLEILNKYYLKKSQNSLNEDFKIICVDHKGMGPLSADLTAFNLNPELSSNIYKNVSRLYDLAHNAKKQNIMISSIVSVDSTITDIYAKDLETGKIESIVRKELLPIPIASYVSEYYSNSVKIKYFQPSFKKYQIYVKSTIVDYDKVFLNRVKNDYQDISDKPVIEAQSISNILKFNTFIKKSKNTLVIGSGTWHINKPIIIPKGYKLIIEPNTKLFFSKDSYIVTYESIIAKSSKDNPIIMKPIDDYWQGIMVINASDTSYFNNVHIFNVKGLKNERWGLTGSIVFYYSNINISNSIISNVISEDALNIIHSKFILNNIWVNNTDSDAFDSDYSTGKVINSKFNDIGQLGGGDAVDFSGSEVLLEKILFKNINDKAISAGENSIIQAKNIEIDRAAHAIVSKDGSKLTIDKAHLANTVNCELMSYQKKSIYGPAKLFATNISLSGEKKECYKAQLGSKIKLEEKYLAEQRLNVKNLYKTDMKKK